MKLNRNLLIISLWCLGLALSGCAKTPPTLTAQQQKDRIVEASFSPQQLAQKELAMEAKKKLAEDLLRELMQALMEPPASKAIKVCKERAPAIASSVSEAKNVRIGRTSFKLRNSENQPPSWAQAYVKSQVSEEVFVQLPAEKFGALFPIKLQSTCLLCHGTNIPSEIKTAIVGNYPQDQATGFSEGDLRGYFWVEIDPLETNQL